MKLEKILHHFKTKKFFYILAFYFIFTSNGFSTSSNLSLTLLPNEILTRIFKFIEIKGANDRHDLCLVSKKFWFLYNNTILNLEHPRAIYLKNPKKLQELIEIQYKIIQYEIKDSSTIPCATLSSRLKYTAFRLEGETFTNSDIKSLIENFPKIKILNFQETKLPSSASLKKLTELSLLTELFLQTCTNFNNPSLLKEIPQLKKLKIDYTQLPENFSFPEDSQLETLIICNSNLSNLPPFENFKKLKYLKIIKCRESNSNFSLPTQLKSFVFKNSGSLPSNFSFKDNNQLEKLKILLYKTEPEPFLNLNSLKNLKFLSLVECSSFNNFECFFSMSQLKTLIIKDTPLPPEPDFIANLVHLENLQISNANILKIPSLELLENLKYLLIERCIEIKDFSFLKSTPKIESLIIEIWRADQNSYLASLKNLKNLKIIDGFGRFDLSIFLKKENFEKLEKFELMDSKLESFDPLKEMKKIKILHFSNCVHLTNLSFLNDLEKIQKITLSQCEEADLSTTTKASIIEEIN